MKMGYDKENGVLDEAISTSVANKSEAETDQENNKRTNFLHEWTTDV